MIRRVRQADKRAVVSTITLTIVAAVLAVVTLTAQGFPPQRTDLNDGGVWITNASIGNLARFVPAVQQRNSEAQVQGLERFDVIQNGKSVVAFDSTTGGLALVNTALGQAGDTPVSFATAVDAALGGTPESTACMLGAVPR